MKPFLPKAPRLIVWTLSVAFFVLATMTLLRVGTYVVFNDQTRAWRHVAEIFWLGFRFDAQIVAAGLLPLLVFGTIPFLNPFKSAFSRGFWLTVLGLLSVSLIVFYICDFLHLRYLHQRLNASIIGLMSDAKIATGMVWQTYPVVRLTLGAAVASVAVFYVFRRLHERAAIAVEPSRKGIRTIWYVSVLLLTLVGAFGRVGQYPLRWSDAFELRDNVSANLALNPVQSFISSLSFRKSGFEADKVQEHFSRIAAYLGVPPDKGTATTFSYEREFAAPSPRPARPPNVVLVICESFSAYKSSMWGNPLDTTPFFNELSKQGLFFDNCFTPHFGTARGVWATITGIPDVERSETASRNPAMVDQHTIINDFEGYEKLYFLGGSASWASIRGLLTNNIRDLKLYEEDSYKAPRVDIWGVSDKSLFLEANERLSAQTKPFFAVIQTADNHRPYTIPEVDLGEFKKIDVPPETLRQSGFQSIEELNAFRYTDYCYKAFITAAKRAPYFDNTIFVFIGDHGIGGNAGTMFPAAWTEKSLTSYHVPMLFYSPKLLKPQRVHSVASMVDLLPTVAGLAGIGYHNSGLGRDLVRQQQIDGGRNNVAFIIDHNDKSIGLVKQSYYTTIQSAVRYETRWADFNHPAPGEINTAEHAEDANMARAIYETARYMLLNNQKSKIEKGSY